MSARPVAGRPLLAAVPWIPLALASLALAAREVVRRRTQLAEPVAAQAAAHDVLPSFFLRAEPPGAARPQWSVDAGSGTAVLGGRSRPALRVEGRARLARDGALESLDLELVPSGAGERVAIRSGASSARRPASRVPGVASGSIRLRLGEPAAEVLASAAWCFDPAGRMHLAIWAHGGAPRNGDARTFRTYDGEPPAERLGLYLVLRNDD